VEKSEIRKKIIKLRKKNYSKNIEINFQSIIKILRKNKHTKKIVGGYYSYNYEANLMPVLEKFEKLNYIISIPKIAKKYDMNFFVWSTNDPLNINKYGIPEPTTNKIVYPDILLVPLVAYDEIGIGLVMAVDFMTDI